MPDHFYVYPAYLDSGLTRAHGRRVPSDSAASEPTLDEIVAAALALGAKATPEPEKQYPAQFHRYSGRVKVVKRPGVAKATFLRDLGREIHRKRGGAARKG